MPTPTQCEQLNAVTDALEETGFKVRKALISKEGVITVYPLIEGAKPEVPPKGWRYPN